jgi:hypothetical protein
MGGRATPGTRKKRGSTLEGCQNLARPRIQTNRTARVNRRGIGQGALRGSIRPAGWKRLSFRQLFW